MWLGSKCARLRCCFQHCIPGYLAVKQHMASKIILRASQPVNQELCRRARHLGLQQLLDSWVRSLLFVTHNCQLHPSRDGL